jgi:uncharacterized protein YbjT (DUF2867 family)
MKDEMSVLVTGATGRQGGAVARELLARGYNVRAMTRKPDSPEAHRLAALGAEIVEGDFNRTASLVSAIGGIWGVFAVQNTWEAGVEQEEEQGKGFAKTCRDCGVTCYVYSSVGSAHRHTGIPHFDNKWRIEETIRKLGFPSFTILRPVFFMENFLAPALRSGLEEGRLTLSLKPTTPLQMIAVDDIGRYGAWAFENYRNLNGRAIDIAGDSRTMPETAGILSRTSGRRIEFDPTPVDEVRQSSEDYAAMLEWFDAVGYNVDIAATSRESGIPPTTLEQWASGVDWPEYIGAAATGAR